MNITLKFVFKKVTILSHKQLDYIEPTDPMLIRKILSNLFIFPKFSNMLLSILCYWSKRKNNKFRTFPRLQLYENLHYLRSSVILMWYWTWYQIKNVQTLAIELN